MKMGAVSPSEPSRRRALEIGSFLSASPKRPSLGLPRVVLADRQTCVRELLKLFLAQTPAGYQVVGEAARGGQLLRLVEKANPDVVIFDLMFPDLSCEEVIRGLRQASPRSRLLAFGSFADERLAEECGALGVHGIVGRESSLEVLRAALRAVCGGRLYSDRRLVRDGFKDNHLAELTEREKHVLRLIAEGWATKEIADLMGGTVKSIARARERVMSKLDLHDAVKLTHYAIRRGLVAL